MVPLEAHLAAHLCATQMAGLWGPSGGPLVLCLYRVLFILSVERKNLINMARYVRYLHEYLHEYDSIAFTMVTALR